MTPLDDALGRFVAEGIDLVPPLPLSSQATVRATQRAVAG
jgi:hypothetical protein